MDYKIKFRNVILPEPLIIIVILLLILAYTIQGLASLRSWSIDKGLYPVGGDWLTDEEADSLHKYRLRCQLRTQSVLYGMNPEKYYSGVIAVLSEIDVYYPDYFERGADIKEAFWETGDAAYLNALVEMTSLYEATLQVNRINLSELEYVLAFDTEEELTQRGRTTLKEVTDSFIGSLEEVASGEKDYYETYILATGFEAYLSNVEANIANYNRSQELKLSETSQFMKELAILQRAFNGFISYDLPLSNRDVWGLMRMLEVLSISLSDTQALTPETGEELPDGIYKRDEKGNLIEIAPNYLYYLNSDGEYEIILDGNVPENAQLYVQSPDGSFVPYTGVDAYNEVE